MRQVLVASLLLAGAVNLVWATLPVLGLASLANPLVVIAHAASGGLLLLGALRLRRGLRWWAAPVVVAVSLYFAVVAPVVLKWLVTGYFANLWSFLSGTLLREGVSGWLKFDVATFQYIMPVYFLCVVLLLGWRLACSRRVSHH